MTIGLIIIGDEILSGKRADKHLPKLVELLNGRGLQLGWAELIGDDPERIVACLRRSFSTGDIVFVCGGIGATPDDHTRQAAAAALGTPLALHPEAKQKIQEIIGDSAREAGVSVDFASAENLQRLKMGEFPLGAEIVPNPFNKIPGFSIKNGETSAHYFLPGFPVMAAPMMEWILDTYYRQLFHQVARMERAVLVYEVAESLLTPLMEQIEVAFPLVRIFSLPSMGDALTRRHIELGVKGEPNETDAAFHYLLNELNRLGAEFINV